MSFAAIPEFNESTTFKRTPFVKIVPNVAYRFRILDTNAHMMEKHYIPSKRISINCNGADQCPICQRNYQLAKDNSGKKVADIPGYLKRQTRYAVNVLNRTVVKIMPDGTALYPVNNTFPSVHNGVATGEIVEQPLNRVEVLERGIKLFKNLNTINDRITDNTGNPLGIHTFDIELMATGAGRTMEITVIPQTHLNDEVKADESDKVDLESLGIVLEFDEIVKLLEGVSLSDIFSARAKPSPVVEEMSENAVGAASENVSTAVADLFS